MMTMHCNGQLSCGLALVSRFAKFSIPYVPPPHFACDIYLILFWALCCTILCVSSPLPKREPYGFIFRRFFREHNLVLIPPSSFLTITIYHYKLLPRYLYS